MTSVHMSLQNVKFEPIKEKDVKLDRRVKLITSTHG